MPLQARLNILGAAPNTQGRAQEEMQPLVNGKVEHHSLFCVFHMDGEERVFGRKDFNGDPVMKEAQVRCLFEPYNGEGKLRVEILGDIPGYWYDRKTAAWTKFPRGERRYFENGDRFTILRQLYRMEVEIVDPTGAAY